MLGSMLKEGLFFIHVIFIICCCISRNFYVVVVPLKWTPGTVKNLKNPDEMDMEEVGCFKLFWYTKNDTVNWLQWVKNNEAYVIRKRQLQNTCSFFQRLTSFPSTSKTVFLEKDSRDTCLCY